MKESIVILFPVILPIVMGLVVWCAPFARKRSVMILCTAAGLIMTSVSVVGVLSQKADSYTLMYLTRTLPVYFHIDSMGKAFALFLMVVWLCAGAYAFAYMKHEKEENRYFGCYLIVFGILLALDFSGNIITFYMCYEFVTLLSFLLVLHTRSREAIMAGLKYLFYSFCGAYMVLFGVYILYRYCDTLTFRPGGILNSELIQGKEPFLLWVVFFMILGFGVKAGMFPMHGWLPTAHPVAPAPASAVLSGVIVKCGVLGVIRTVYFLFGTELLWGTWVQQVWQALTLFTIFMGSMLAYREKVLKKRLAYSTVSQVSYILFGLSVMNQTALAGAVLHVVSHALIKCALFLCAGAFIVQTGKTRVEELTGIGREMPVLMWCYTVCSLALVGIPPTGGFVSKWYLAMGSLEEYTTAPSLFSWLGPVVLLVSALLTAGYLLPVTVRGFFPGKELDCECKGKKEPEISMLLPIIILTVLSVLAGVFPEAVTGCIAGQIR